MNKIDELNTSYLIPGVEQGTTAIADTESFEEDYGDAPYSQLPPLTDIPSPTGWQDLLGLNQMLPSPNRIDPPPRPMSYTNGTIANSADSRLRLATDAQRNSEGTAASPKVERMMSMLAGYDQAARRIRSLASKGGGQ